jgi:hypothetical protein
MVINPTAGHWLVGSTGQCAPGTASSGYLASCTATGAPFSAAALVISDSLGNVAQGNVSTNGTAVTFYSGLPFGVQGCSFSGGCAWNGGTIKINGTNYTISTVNSLTSLTLTTSAGSNTNVAYVGPAWGCTDTSLAPGLAVSNCWAYVSTGGSTDTVTVTGPDNYSLSFSVADISNSTSLGSLDVAACPLANCNLVMQSFTSQQTSPQIKQTLNLTTTGELVYYASNQQVGPITPASGTTGLVIGTNLSNQTGMSAETFSSSGATTISQADGASADVVLQGALAFTSSGATNPSLPAVQLSNFSCSHGQQTNSYCDMAGGVGSGLGNGVGDTFSGMLVPGILGHCEVQTSATFATPKDTVSNTWTDWGPGAVHDSTGAYYIECWYAENTSSQEMDVITIGTATGQAGLTAGYAIDWELVGSLPTSSPRDGGSNVGYCSNPTATSGSGGAVTACATSTTGPMVTATNGDTVVGFYSPDNGPPSSVGSGYTNVYSLFPGGSAWFKIQATAGSINPPATDGYGSGDDYAGEGIAFKPLSTAVKRHRVMVTYQ